MSKPAHQDPELGYQHGAYDPHKSDQGYPAGGYPVQQGYGQPPYPGQPVAGQHGTPAYGAPQMTHQYQYQQVPGTGVPTSQYVPGGPTGYAPGGPSIYAAGPTGPAFDGVAVDHDNDNEGTAMLSPEMDKNENMLRWGFIRKVYGIISVQLILTTGIALAIMFAPGAKEFFHARVWFPIILLIAALLLYIPLYMFRNKHPHNLVVLVLWTSCFAVSIGIFASSFGPVEVAMAFGMTAAVVVGLTLFTFWGVKRGMSFSFLGPFLFAGLITLMMWSLFQIIFRRPIGRTIYSLIAVLIFSGYIVYDTELLIKRFPLDEYIIAATILYVDIINLFMHILALMGAANR